ncbi:hypothetical protein BDR26DRAFT_862259 [Obelidium mucronatum]|nr:hypothetical protein BDR26DRAFT_862259 [Obelidium mucronatum]
MNEEDLDPKPFLSSKTLTEEPEKLRPSKVRSIWAIEWSIWFLIGAAFAIWFSGYRAVFKLISASDPVTILHIVGGSVFTFACVWNLAHPPSHGTLYRTVHIIVGRSAILTYVVLFVVGAIKVWNGSYSKRFAIGLTIGGAISIVSMTIALIAITRKPRTALHVTVHRFAMTMMFFGGCLIPAVVNFPRQFSTRSENSTFAFYGWIFPLVVGLLHLWAVKRKSVV